MSAVNLLQFINPKLEVILIRLDHNKLKWDTVFNDKVREEYHKHKMESKNKRPDSQMKILNIPSGKVSHIILN